MGSHRTGQPETESHHRTGDGDRHVGRRREDRRLRSMHWTAPRTITSVGAATTTVTLLAALAEGRPHLPTQSRRRSRPHDRFGRTDDRLQRSIPRFSQPAPTTSRATRPAASSPRGPAVKGRCGLRLQVRRSRIVHRGRRRRALRHAEGSQRRRADPLHDVRRRTTARLGRDSEPVSLTFQLVDTSEGVWVRKSNGELFERTESEAKIYTGTVSVSAADSFEILVENVPPRLPVVQRQRRRGYGQQRSGMRPPSTPIPQPNTTFAAVWAAWPPIRSTSSGSI